MEWRRGGGGATHPLQAIHTGEVREEVAELLEGQGKDEDRRWSMHAETWCEVRKGG